MFLLRLSHTVSATTLACFIERLVGYPDCIFQRCGHPVTWAGALIARLDTRLNGSKAYNERQRRRNGVFSCGVIVGLPVVLAGQVARIRVLEPLFLSTLVAQKSLDEHVTAVRNSLARYGLQQGQRAVAKIVGRDPDTLDEPAVIRAAIESLAENFSDGVVAPLFWSAVFGLKGGIAYKAINTADSMIGHRSARYRAFGRASARLDDVCNLPASRMSALWIALAAATLPDANPMAALKTVRTDARYHRSPNAGWPEAAMAGALGLRLAGPRVYDGQLVHDRWMGNGRDNATLADLDRALRLYRRACLIQRLALLLLSAVLTGFARRSSASTSRQVSR